MLGIALLCFAFTSVPLTPSGLYIVVDGVYVNETGPFRFLVDTGAQTSALAPAVAERLGVAAAYRVEQVTVTGKRLTPAGLAQSVRIGSARVDRVELLLSGMEGVHRLDPSLDGVLGQNVLSAFDYYLEAGSLMIGPRPPTDASRIPFRLSEGRMAVDAQVDGFTRTLILDSGAPGLILFVSSPSEGADVVYTNAGRAPASVGSAHVRVGPLARRMASIALRARERGVDGLLPLSAFRSIYVNQRERYVVLNGEFSRDFQE